MAESDIRNTAIALSLAIHAALFWTYGERIWKPADRPLVSAPIVAGVYQPALASVGLLMAVAGNILGIYAALLCAWLLALVGG